MAAGGPPRMVRGFARGTESACRRAPEICAPAFDGNREHSPPASTCAVACGRDRPAHDGGWHVETDAGVRWRAASLVLTPPVPQSLALVESGGFMLDAGIKARLARISYDPCIAVMATFAGIVKLPEPGAVQIEGGEPVNWIADNNRKGVSPLPSALTSHLNGLPR